ncbi:MAG: phosphoribosyl-AMP cyclohydrolase [Chloroflexaceae bacterium]|nr:phosphoribosyl-AMP cyclohydrolase [Chloroflexaceae bacterium]
MLKFDQHGLIPAIVQHARSGEVLMLGYMNADSLQITRESGMVTFWSRSRQELWRKGETSGNFLQLVALRQDCDSDVLLVLAEPVGPTCHTGKPSCFFRDLDGHDVATRMPW